MKNISNAQSYYMTADLGIAVFLFTIGHELIKTTLQGPKRLIFHFKRQTDTEKRIADFLSEKGEAPAKKLFENYRALRALAYSRTGNLK